MIGNLFNKMAERQTAAILLIVALVILLVFPWAAGEGGRYYTSLLMTVFLFATLGHAWNLLAGFCGLLSFGIQVYIGLAGFTVAILNYYFNVPVWVGVICGAGVAGLFAWLLAAPISDQSGKRQMIIGLVIAVLLWAAYEVWIVLVPTADIFGGAYIRRVIILLTIFLGMLPLLKLQGAYFAVATWLIAAAVTSVFNEWRLTGAGGGMNIVSETTSMERYYVGLLILIASTAVVWKLLNSRYGDALTAVRDDEEAATAIGIDVRRIKSMVFVISAPIAALAAGLFYVDSVTITPNDAFHIRWSAYVVFIVVAGGMGTLSGPIVGAIAFVIIQRFLSGLWGGGELTLGLASVLLILLLPRGIMGLVQELRTRAKTAPPVQRKASLFSSPAKLAKADTSHIPEGPGLVAALMVPGSPLPMLNGSNPAWKDLVAGYEAAREALEAARPDVILVYSGQWMAVLDQLWQTSPHLRGTHVDENWHEYGALNYDFRTDREGTLACIAGCDTVGVRAKPVDFDHFPIDSGTIVANGFLNERLRAPLIIASANIYHDYETTRKLGEMAAREAIKLGRRVAIIGVGGLSGSIFRQEIDPQNDRIKSPEDDALNRKMLELMEAGDRNGIDQFRLEFTAKARADNNFKHFAWLQGAMGSEWSGAKVLAYGPAWGAGSAVVQFDLNRK